MRWLWRIFVLFLLLSFVKSVVAPQPQAFIAWPEQSNLVRKIQWDWRQWRRGLQDLPASIEVEIRRLRQDFRPDGNGTSV
ncbi:Hypothetical protein DEACI_1805 [Acididesulfobacillus acetoxydans]|uniref:Uncharacterized protein n=1 Tax=Acididesulfobacillus acetoxydans TaxID=1561005 RepID=A0A8S0WFL1_9FIRM|nr:hypothetical protein [Acididesulfobacillus acetoxydans]CAA7601152.1 Hypothetical protein DEACI_1805 [Acididesulfobacillus acetoxydans]CEJ08569.1 Hypothetical protein DEACI_3048 [Acididesulfobacillus acetoxydans]